MSLLLCILIIRMELPVKHSHYSDEELLELIVGRDVKALEELYERHAQTVYNVIMRIVKEPTIAQNLLQETFWQVWKKAAGFKGRGVAAAWIYRIARNKSLDQLRRQKARPQSVNKPIEEHFDLSHSNHDANLTSVEMQVQQKLHREQIRGALNQIPIEQRLCLELAYFEGMSQSEIADKTQTPLGTIKTRVRMGLKKLERLLRASGYQKQDI